MFPRPARIAKLHPVASYAHRLLCPQYSTSELNAKELKLSKFLLINRKFRRRVQLKASLADFVYSCRAFGLTRVFSLSSYFLFYYLFLSFSYTHSDTHTHTHTYPFAVPWILTTPFLPQYLLLVSTCIPWHYFAFSLFRTSSYAFSQYLPLDLSFLPRKVLRLFPV